MSRKALASVDGRASGRMITFAADTAAAAAAPPGTPNRIAQARMLADAHSVGSVGAPSWTCRGVSATTVSTTAPHATARSAPSTGRLRRRAEEYAHVHVTVHTAMPASTSPATTGWR